MCTGGRKNESWFTATGVPAKFGFLNFPGSNVAWKNLTVSSAGGRNSSGQGVGLYEAFFTLTNITKIALVDSSSNTSDPTAHTNSIIYNLVDASERRTGTNNESIFDILKRLDAYALAQNWPSGMSRHTNNDTIYNAPSVTDFTAGPFGYSGLKTFQNGNWTDENGGDLDKFAIWGINNDSDNDTQVLAAYSGSLGPGNGKSDSWRNQNPKHTFWSYWGNDWHSNSLSQTISATTGQTYPGINNTNSVNQTVYLLAYG